jgi:AraC-like DNA-binding protein
MDEQIKKMENLDMVDLSMGISSGGFVLCEASWWKATDDWHEPAKLYFPVRGKAWVRAGGVRTILHPRRLYLLPPGGTISFGTPVSMEVHWLHFFPHSVYLQRRLAGEGKVVCFGPAFSARWSATCRLIARFVEYGSEEDACRIQAMLLEVVGAVLAKSPAETAEERATYDRLRPALELLDRSQDRPVRLAELARAVALSAEHFHRLFRQALGTTPLHYALRRRMNRAQQLLSEGRLSVAEVAERCGYYDPFYFSKVFRRYFGVTAKKVSQGRGLATLP